jgi:flagellar operon protein (TIGR03826 family)
MVMEIRNCKRCGNVFSYSGNKFCTNCIKEDEEDFVKVKDFLNQNPNAKLVDISREIDVGIEKVRKFLRDGRLEIVGDNNFLIECDNCGTPIKSGRFCEECLRTTRNNLQSASQELTSQKEEREAKKKDGGFYFKDINKNKNKK